eukprot:CAMPEP_0184854828 /NCGR_PEP_ID=MMETSP0580-20130426/211_1 /TAXON_ID=1118495 /ORGANISM="Dactyliosolen fragilissimus" /LENGTH=626 /DNA_ID=CAMNT_0027349171 /DNA_START=30 /DNA_END=1910 /DNA_ORIENTATION=-
MVKKKGKSKRTTLKDKYKIQRRVVESQRKSRKQSKRDAKSGIIRHDKKKKRDPGIPNSWPFKQDLLNDIARAREKAEENKRMQKEQRERKMRGGGDDDDDDDDNMEMEDVETSSRTTSTTTGKKVPANLQDLMHQADSSRAAFEARTITGTSTHVNAKVAHGQSSRRAYLGELHRVIEASDVILQVLDARDPIGTRIHPRIEDTILSRYDKKMVLLLNKIDLVPNDAVSGWLTHLRRSRPTLAIQCTSTSHNNNNTNNSTYTTTNATNSTTSTFVKDHLLQLLKNYARNGKSRKDKGCITVGIIGYPNVGKSSIINTLKRSSTAVGVSPRPGFTTSMKEVVLDKNLRLLDSPGVVFDDGGGATVAQQQNHDSHGSANADGGGMVHSNSNSERSGPLLINCLDAASMDDPIPAIDALLKRCTVESLVMTYAIPLFPKHDTMTFLALIAKRAGRVKKGGIPDKVAAARTVLKDWNEGKIPYYTPPPVAAKSNSNSSNGTTSTSSSTILSDAKIMTEFAQEFDISQMDNDILGSSSKNKKDDLDFVKLEPMQDDTMQTDVDASTQGAIDYLTHAMMDNKNNGSTSKQMNDNSSNHSPENRATMNNNNSSAKAMDTYNVADAEDYNFDDM